MFLKWSAAISSGIPRVDTCCHCSSAAAVCAAAPACGIVRFALRNGRSSAGSARTVGCQPCELAGTAVTESSSCWMAGTRSPPTNGGPHVLQEIDDLSRAFTVVVTSRPGPRIRFSSARGQCYEICELPPEGVDDTD